MAAKPWLLAALRGNVQDTVYAAAKNGHGRVGKADKMEVESVCLYCSNEMLALYSSRGQFGLCGISWPDSG